MFEPGVLEQPILRELQQCCRDQGTAGQSVSQSDLGRYAGRQQAGRQVSELVPGTSSVANDHVTEARLGGHQTSPEKRNGVSIARALVRHKHRVCISVSDHRFLGIRWDREQLVDNPWRRSVWRAARGRQRDI